MKKAQGLKTLGDYRRVAKDSLFSIHLPPENKSTSHYDAIKTALFYSRNLINSSRINTPEADTWGTISSPGTKYERINNQLFYIIKLMEFTKAYHEVKSIDELFPDLRKRPDVKIIVFDSSGFTYLEAAFKYLLKFGRDIILSSLQDAYLKYRKENNIHGRFDLVGSTPEVIDKLKINPVPDKIIKTWFDNIVNKVQRRFPESQSSEITVEANFDSTLIQIEYEWNDWEKGGQLPVKRLGQLNGPQGQFQPNQYLDDISDKINKIIAGHRAPKDKFCKHITKVIGEAEKYLQYLQEQRQKSKHFCLWDVFLNEWDMEEYIYFAGDEDPFVQFYQEQRHKWLLWDAFLNDWEMGECVYFAGDEDLFVQFYMEEKPKPDPLSYLYSMIWGAAEPEQEYKGLEVLDYQFILLAIIHDVQNWQAGRELIYFNPRKGERLSDRLCRAVWRRLEKNQAPNVFKDVQVTINTAMLAVRANLEQEKDEHGSIESGEQVKKITKLTDFILNCCEDTTSIPSKANRIHEFVKKGEIKFMPKPINKTKGNQTKLYNEEKLRRIWPKLKEKIKSLPNLKD